MSARAGSGLGSLRAVLVGALLACASVLGCARQVHAQSDLVLLLVPQTPDPALVELFHRVEAELRLHDFRPEVLVAAPGDSTEALLGAQASAKRAFAAIAIAEQTPFAMLHVWIVDPRTGLTRQYRVEQKGGQEPTNVVAVRAVDLLRANRALPVAPEPSQPAAATPPAAAGSGRPTGASTQTEAGAARKPASAVAPRAASEPKPSADESASAEDGDRDDGRESSADDEREIASEARDEPEEREDEPEPTFSSVGPTFQYKPTLLQIAADVTGLSLSRRLGWSFGPSLGVWLTLGDRWRIGLVGVAPLWGALLHAALGEAKIWQQLAWLELGARLVRAGPLQLSAAGGFGLHWLQAKGKALSPFRDNNASAWSWTGSLAARADVMLTPRWSIGLTLRARIFLPAVEVAAKTESARLAFPALEGALGLSFWL